MKIIQHLKHCLVGAMQGAMHSVRTKLASALYLNWEPLASRQYQCRFGLAPPVALLAAVLLIGAVAAADRLAPDDGYNLNWWTMDTGGGQANGGNYQLSATLGQVDTGEWAGGNYRLQGGFWIALQPRRIFLPSIIK